MNSFDVLDEAAPSDLMNNIIWFTNNLDPNGLGHKATWPQWDPQDPRALVFQDSFHLPRIVIEDNYRSAAMEFMRNISLINPI